MAKKHLDKIFLSASIPSTTSGDKKFYDTADVIAIRDAVRALAAVVIPNAHLVWGGHPSITPLIRYVLERMNTELKDHVTLYQSLIYKDSFPADNFAFENMILTSSAPEIETSIDIMRDQMIGENEFEAGVFIGGMKGVLDEFRLFRRSHPKALILPVASTGAAAKMLYEDSDIDFDKRLKDDYAYMGLFRDLLAEFIK